MKIGIGIAGASGAFARFIAEAIEEMGGARITGLVSRHPERAERVASDLRARGHSDAHAHANYSDVLADPTVELVVISTPPALHAPMGIEAARAGKAIFIEKPVATSIDDARALLEAVRQTGVAAGVDFVMRYNPLFNQLHRWTVAGVLGSLRRVDFQNFAGDEYLPPDHWFWDRDQSGGILVEHGVHFFDIYGYLAGAPPVEVHGTLTTRPGTDQQDKVLADVLYANGAVATYYHAFDKPSRLERTTATLGYDRGYVDVDGWIPMSLTVDALVDDGQRAALTSTPYLTEAEMVDAYDEKDRRTHGNGQEYHVSGRIRATLRLPRSKEDVYRTAVADALRDVIALMGDPSHRPHVSLADGARALAVACAATSGQTIADEWFAAT
jgi:predicted dehydrogenase